MLPNFVFSISIFSSNSSRPSGGAGTTKFDPLDVRQRNSSWRLAPIPLQRLLNFQSALNVNLAPISAFAGKAGDSQTAGLGAWRQRVGVGTSALNSKPDMDRNGSRSSRQFLLTVALRQLARRLKIHTGASTLRA
jgi:hypothetical protein